MKAVLRPGLLILAGVALCSALMAADAPSGAITVWDGDSAAVGAGWAAPKVASNTAKAGDTAGKEGKKALEFHGVGAEYIGFGWNWCRWTPADAGTDISGCDRMRFNFKVTGDAKPADFKIHLGSSTKTAASSVDVDVSQYMNAKDKGKIDDGEWHEIVIPLKDFTGGDKKFDAKKAWELDVSEWSQDKKDFTAFVDNVQFLPAAAAVPATAK